jgi:hypothetical protein
MLEGIADAVARIVAGDSAGGSPEITVSVEDGYHGIACSLLPSGMGWMAVFTLTFKSEDGSWKPMPKEAVVLAASRLPFACVSPANKLIVDSPAPADAAALLAAMITEITEDSSWQ